MRCFTSVISIEECVKASVPAAVCLLVLCDRSHLLVSFYTCINITLTGWSTPHLAQLPDFSDNNILRIVVVMQMWVSDGDPPPTMRLLKMRYSTPLKEFHLWEV